MGHRYFSEQRISGNRVDLTGSEAHHLLHVMRAKRGAEIQVFDGSGYEYRCRVTAVARDRATLSVICRSASCRELPHRVLLAVALPKADRARWIVEKATELGVAALVPLVTEHTTATPTARQTLRWRRAVVEASKQCGRNRLMDVEEPCRWSRFIDDVHNGPARDAPRIMADPAAACPWYSLKDPAAENATRGYIIAVGPEGGFTDREREMAVDRGWQTVCLGRRILRVETAALALAAWACREPTA